LNGDNTLSENWADFGGITISLHALKKELAEKNATKEEIKKAYQTFFIAYAVSWRTLVRKKKLLYSIMTSVHAPPDDRVDRIVVQFSEWVEAFDIKETDPLYIPNSKRLKFF
jgi:predicted metalloendopeptidase